MEKNQSDFFIQYRNKLFSYINNLVLLTKLEATSKLAKLMSMMVIWAIIGILTCMVILFGSFCAAYFFSDLFDSNMKGFGLVAIIYVVVTVLIIFMGKNFVKKFIVNQIISIIFEKTANDNDEEKAENTAD
ncbi:MAG: hypothetical protein DI598_01295 [Pseudopedobacter saltans]|uniref:Phage holin family protein n=1 Tax=Pseudopedobacter saltans TaxID=151895 RepID=A0A2W5HEU3_9SPHI|nr:MAG: hypothetical protein DI598_01295 [Pseudopedobacter saltans]